MVTRSLYILISFHFFSSFYYSYLSFFIYPLRTYDPLSVVTTHPTESELYLFFILLDIYLLPVVTLTTGLY